MQLTVIQCFENEVYPALLQLGRAIFKYSILGQGDKPNSRHLSRALPSVHYTSAGQNPIITTLEQGVTSFQQGVLC